MIGIWDIIAVISAILLINRDFIYTIPNYKKKHLDKIPVILFLICIIYLILKLILWDVHNKLI